MAKGRPPRIPQRQIKLQPQRSAAIQAKFQQALAFHQRGQLTQAEFFYRKILAQLPNHFDVLHMLGVIEAQRKNSEAAVELIDRALQLKPDDAEAFNNRGVALRDLKRHEEALASYDRALQLKPDYAEALTNRGVALGDLKRYQEALVSYDRALQLKPDYAEALTNRGVALGDLKRYQEALASYDCALQLKPDYAEALSNRGNALRDLRRHEEALASYDRALQLKPDYAEALNNRGNALRDLRRHEEALASYDRALQLRPDYAEALANRGNTLRDLNRPDEAARSFARLREIAPDCDYALGYMCNSQLHSCDWTYYAQHAERVVQAVEGGKKVDTPFSFLAVSQSAAAQLRCSRTYSADQYLASATPLWAGRRYQHDRIRIAYISADFREHPVSYLTAGLLEKHDRERFETIALSLRPEHKSTTGQRVKAAFNRFVDVSGTSDRDVAALMRELEVDIAVDLMGFTSDCRTGIFAHRPAPVQVNYLGFPATMGAEYIDYLIADRFVIPEEKQAYYAEKVVYLPDSFQANDDQRKISETVPTRLEAGLPESGFVFCSFNNSYKINPPVFEVWMRLLKTVAGSVLWLVAGHDSIKNNLRREAEERGVEPSRLVFAPRLPYADHLARFQLADLFLDTLPFNAGTTASDALWAGVPVLTCAGEAFASRMAGSLLNAVGLLELITYSMEEYEALALKLATTPAMLSDMKARLARNRTTHPLFDTDRFRRHIESAYVTMWERVQRGELPESFAVQA